MSNTGVNHWKPGGNTLFAGDCMPFCKDGVFHLYYLLDCGHHNHPIIGGLGGHQYAHAVSTDLIHWEHKPIALGVDLSVGKCSNCTGSMLEVDGKIFVFFSERSMFYSGEQLRIGVSYDGGDHFENWDHIPELTPPADCCGQFRDPQVFRTDDGLIHLLMSSGCKTDGFCHGKVAHYTTKDMIHYEEHEPWLTTDGIPECADYFEWNGKYYYSCNISWETFFHISDSPLGPWTKTVPYAPASRFCAVMKTAPWKDGRRIGVGWVPSLVNGHHIFGGRIVFRELVQKPDGSLGTMFLNEVLPCDFVKKTDGFEVSKSAGFSVKNLGEVPRNFRMDGVLKFKSGTRKFGFVVMEEKQDYRAFITFNPEKNSVSMLGTSIVEVPFENNEVRFRFVRTSNVLDLEINGNRTIVTEYYDMQESVVSFFVDSGAIEVSEINFYN